MNGAQKCEKEFSLNGHTTGLHAQTQKLQLHFEK